MRRLVVIFLSCIFAFGLFASNMQERAEASPIGISAGFEYWNNYFWRGLDFFGQGNGVIFPYLYWGIGNSGLSVMYMGQYASKTFFDGTDMEEEGAGKGLVAYEGAHFNLAYKVTIAEAVTIGISGWYYWFYRSEDKLGYDQSWAEGTASLTINALPLNPTISYTHDYYVDSGATVDSAGVRGEGEQGRDYYVKFALSHPIELVSGSTLGLGLSAGYFNYKSQEKKGFSDIVASTKLTTMAGLVSVFGRLNFAYVPDEEFNSDGINKYRWWADFGVAVSF